jgi:hypothetical protein
LLRVVTEERRVFSDQLYRLERRLATELRDVGNEWAHNKSFSDEDTDRPRDTMERLLHAVGATQRPGRATRERL